MSSDKDTPCGTDGLRDGSVATGTAALCACGGLTVEFGGDESGEFLRRSAIW